MRMSRRDGRPNATDLPGHLDSSLSEEKAGSGALHFRLVRLAWLAWVSSSPHFLHFCTVPRDL